MSLPTLPSAARPEFSDDPVLFITGQLTIGGAERQLDMIGVALARTGRTVLVAAFNDGPRRAELEGAGVHVELISGSKLQRVRHLIRVARQYRPRLVVAWHFYTAPYARIAALAARARWMSSLRSSLVHEEQTAPRATALSLRLSSFVLANSYGGLRELRERGKQCAYLANAVDLVPFESIDPTRAEEIRAQITKSASERSVIAAIGVLRPEKRFELFLQILDELRRRGRDVQGVLVGEGPERNSLERLAQDLDLGDQQVLFVGSTSDVAAVLAEVDVTVMTSRTEGTPNVLLESMAASIPFVTTDVGDAGELARRSSGGVVSEADAASFADHLQEFLDNDELRRTAGQRGRTYIEEHHALDDQAERFLAAIRSAR